MKRVKFIVYVYSLLFSASMLLAGYRNIKTLHDLLMLIAFLPIVIYVVIKILQKIPVIKHLFITPAWFKIGIFLFIYNFIFLSILLYIGVRRAVSTQEILLIAWFIPLYILLLVKIGRGFLRVIKNFKEYKIKHKITEINQEELDKKDGVEHRRRQFLKLIAGTGIGMFVMYLLNPKKIGAAFFGSIPGPGTVAIKDSGGTKIDPSIKSPTDSYGISDTSEATYPHYFGFVHYNGTDWYILKESSSGGYTYASKLNNATFTYASAWTNKAAASPTGPTYASFDAAF